MTFSLQAAALLLPGYIRIGSLRLTVYGLIAAAALIAALWLSQRTAPRAGLPANKLWDAGVFAIIAAFITSRVLLIAFDFRAFLKYPLIVLSLPSLTYGGMILTALFVWLWLRRKHLPLRDVLDAWAPCAALLAAVLSIAHFVEGTDAGMPTQLPWGVITPGDTILGRVHPVQLYEALLAALFAARWLRNLQMRRYSGQVAFNAMLWAGFWTFFLDMLRQPESSQGAAFLDPRQYVSLFVMVLGGVMLMIFYESPPPPGRNEVAEILENFALGRGGPVDHERVEFATFTDPLLIEIQQQVIPMFGPMDDKDCEKMLSYVHKLRENPIDQESGSH